MLVYILFKYEAPGGGGGGACMHFTGTKPRPILLVPDLALDSVDVKTKKCLARTESS